MISAENRFTKFTWFTVEQVSVYGPFHVNSRGQVGAETSKSELQLECTSLQMSTCASELSAIDLP